MCVQWIYCLISVKISHSESKVLSSWWHHFGPIPIPPHCKMLGDLIALQLQKTCAKRLANLTIIAANAYNTTDSKHPQHDHFKGLQHFQLGCVVSFCSRCVANLVKTIPEFAGVSSICMCFLKLQFDDTFGLSLNSTRHSCGAFRLQCGFVPSSKTASKPTRMFQKRSVLVKLFAQI